MSMYFTNEVIARRLHISLRQVSRILAKHELNKNGGRRKAFLSYKQENLLMEIARESLGHSYEEIAWRHGLTRQAVHRRLAIDD